MDISNEAKTVLHALYSEYKSRRTLGFTKMDAKFFNSINFVQEQLLPDMPLSDVEDSLRELDEHGLVENFYASGTIYTLNLTNTAIVKIENLPKETLLNALDFISKFIP